MSLPQSPNPLKAKFPNYDDYYMTSFSDHVEISELYDIFKELMRDKWLGSPSVTDDEIFDYLADYDLSDLKHYCLRDELGEIMCFAEVQGCSDFGVNTLTIFTPIKHRGMGYGRELASELLDRKLFDVWVCRPDNQISYDLAESLGLNLFTTKTDKHDAAYHVFIRV